MERRSTQDQRQVNNQAKIIEMKSTQKDNKIEEIIQLPNLHETLYTVISENCTIDKDKGVHANNQESKNKKKNRTTDYGNRTSKLVQKITDDTDGTDGTDDTDDTDGTDDTDISYYRK